VAAGQPVLRDVIDYDLKILFVGYNPSLRSAEVGHHYAGRSNRFWQLLHRSGLTPVLLRPEQDIELLRYGYGATNIVHRPTKTAAEIIAEEYRAGRAQLRETIKKYRPQVVCYVGIGIYKVFSRRSKVDWGLQAESVIPGVRDFAAPSSSGLNRMKLADQVKVYRDLKNFVEGFNIKKIRGED
jgi:TDG/mug DNA glycosylase family protein